MAKPVVLMLNKALGLNNVSPPERLPFDPETGVAAFQASVNVEVEMTGLTRRIRGYTKRREEASQDIFAAGGDCLLVSVSALYRFNPVDFSRTGLRSGLTPGLKMRYLHVNDRIYYSNTAENGSVQIGGASYSWLPSGDYIGPETLRTYEPPPLFKHMELYNGRIYGATVDNDIYASAPRAFAWFNKADDVLPLSLQGLAVLGIAAVDSGFYVLSDKGIFYLHGEDIQSLAIRQVSDSPAKEDCVVKTLGQNILRGKFQQYGKVVLAMTQSGLCALGNDGVFANLTYDSIELPRCSGISMSLHKNRLYTLLKR
jgi:hypothetical protein